MLIHTISDKRYAREKFIGFDLNVVLHFCFIYIKSAQNTIVHNIRKENY